MPTPLERAEKDLQHALLSLQSTLSKSTRAQITSLIPLDSLSPDSGTESKSIDQNARELEDAIDKLITVEEQSRCDVQGAALVKELVRKWYRGMYPFMDLILKVSQNASQVCA